MSSDAVRKELKSFLNSHNPGVFVIKGSWGTGKTYLVNEVVEENRSKLEGRNYAYVSLFGVNSLEELRENIFIGTETAKPQEDVEIPKILTRNRDVHRFLKWVTEVDPIRWTAPD